MKKKNPYYELITVFENPWAVNTDTVDRGKNEEN